MATREELAFIRDARAGNPSAQLALGKRYLFGGTGLKKNLTTSLYWLRCAADRSMPEAWLLIGSHVPYEVAASSPDPDRVSALYERAYDAGIARAGMVWAKLVLKQIEGNADHPVRSKALAALRAAAGAGIAEAEWLLAQELKNTAGPDNKAEKQQQPNDACAWAARAAANGVLQAQYALADHAWSGQDYPVFLRWALPLARLAVEASGKRKQLPARDIQLLTRCGRAMIASATADSEETESFLQTAASAGDKQAQFTLGAWHANLTEDYQAASASTRRSNYTKSVHWLSRAGEQGETRAWYVLYLLSKRPNADLTKYGISKPLRYLERAAEGGCQEAQLEAGIQARRARHKDEENDVRAAYWLQKAAFQGSTEAARELNKIAATNSPADWAVTALQALSRETITSHPFLAARLEMAATFGLSIPEALLADPKESDRGHCLLIDIRALRPRSKRRLILIENGTQRTALTRIARQFMDIDCGPSGPEGGYRRRLYLLQKLFPNLTDKENTATQ